MTVAASVAATVCVLHLPAPLLPDTFLVLAGGLIFLAGLALASGLPLTRSWHGCPRGGAGALALLGALPLLALESALRWQTQLLPEACERLPVRLAGTLHGLPRRYQQHGDSLYRIDLDEIVVMPGTCAGPRRVRLYVAGEDLPLSDHAVAVPLKEGLGADGSLGEGSQRTPDRRAERLVDALAPGKRLLLEARLRRPWGMVNPGALTGSRYAFLDGIHAIGSGRVLGLDQGERGEIALRARIDRLRLRLSRWVRDNSAPTAAALLAALAVGDQRFLEPADWDRLRVFGLTHLVVISGLHVSLLALPGWCLGAGLARLPRASPALARCLPPVCALLPAGIYSLLAGFSLPTQRALLMLLLACLPRLAGRRASPPRLLALVASLLLLLDPRSVLGSSFWLSLGAVALLLYYVSCRDRQGGLRAFAGAQVFMLAAMFPAGLLVFGSSGGPGGLANLVAIPLIAFFAVPLLLLSLLLHIVHEPAALATLVLPSLVMEALWNALAYWEPSLAGWAPSTLPAIAALLLGLLAVLLLVLPSVPGRHFVALCLLAPIPLAAAFSAPEDFSLLVFDVGQGTAILVREGDAALLYDTGPGPPGGPAVAARTVLPALARLGVEAIDLLVVSHPDQDHAAGEAVLRSRLPPARIRRGRGDAAQLCRLGALERLGKTVTVQYLSVARPGDSDNNASCVLMIETRGRRFLLPGDIDADRERELVAYWGERLAADVLLAAHHGSGSGSSQLLLRTVSPRFLVVTAARANRFGHPAGAVLKRAAQRDIAVLNTATGGAIEFVVDPTGHLRCRRFRHALAPFWRAGPATRVCRAER